MQGINKNRIKKEIEMLSQSPPTGVSCHPVDDKLDLLSAQIMGEKGTAYEGGLFQLEIQIPDRYPFDPPRIRFITPVYHPNIDTNGRICLDTLKLPPKGTWRPCLNISTVLMMIRILMGEPGSEDPLMTSIWQEYKYNYAVYVEKAKQWTRQYAMESCLTKANLVKNAAKEERLENNSVSPAEQEKLSEKPINNRSQAAENNSVSNEVSLLPSSKSDVYGTKTKKGLGLWKKRQALEECNTNMKAFKTS